MPPRIEKTVFISYRRRDISWALAVYQDLTHNGYDVFFDYTSIPSGDFEQIIISNIKARAHFVLILTPTTLDRCDEPGDWLRREIEKAMDEKRNIIPLFFDGFNFGAKNVSEKLTGKLKNVSRYNGMNVHHDYFQEGMERLRSKFLGVPLEAVLHPISTEVQEVVKEEKRAADEALLQGVKEKKAEKPKTKEKKPVIEVPKSNFVEKFQIAQKFAGRIINFENDIVFSNGMEFMCVPAGKFIMGSDKGESNEKPQHTVDIPYDYWMGRYPITNEQYNGYVKAKGIQHPVPDWQKKKDHPVVSVSWDTVMEYCQWLNNLIKAELPSGLILRLPTEAEWEKAARGPSTGSGGEREYPWGNTFDKNKCNSSEGGKGGTTPVGLYSPQGDSPYGCADMAGNVWEWTHSEYKAYPYDARDGREDEKKGILRVLRGGAFNNNERRVRCASRYRFNSLLRYFFIGFRCVVGAVSPISP